MTNSQMLARMYPIGTTVATLPHTDAWMAGDRYGVVVGTGARWVRVLCDRSERVRRFRWDDIRTDR